MIITPLNNQKPEAASTELFELEYIEAFPTIQGEGPFSGLPAIFLRLAGCNIKCPACDTQYTEGRVRVQGHYLAGVLNEMARIGSCKPVLVITGGEPFRQGPALWNMIGSINPGLFHKIQIETNGTLPWRDSDQSVVTAEMLKRMGVHIVVSPKSGISAWCYSLQTQDYWEDIRDQFTWKYVLTHKEVDPVDGLPTRVLGRAQRPGRPVEVPSSSIFIQPADLKDEELNKLNLAACVESSMRFGYRLSLQVHKLAGLD